MKIPWVSRERFDEERARAVKAETALEDLRQKFLDYIQNQQSAAPVIGENTDLSKIQPIAGRPTIANIIDIANRDAYKIAQIPGAESVTEQLAKARDRMNRTKAAANGN